MKVMIGISSSSSTCSFLSSPFAVSISSGGQGNGINVEYWHLLRFIWLSTAAALTMIMLHCFFTFLDNIKVQFFLSFVLLIMLRGYVVKFDNHFDVM